VARGWCGEVARGGVGEVAGGGVGEGGGVGGGGERVGAGYWRLERDCRCIDLKQDS